MLFCQHFCASGVFLQKIMSRGSPIFQSSWISEDSMKNTGCLSVHNALGFEYASNRTLTFVVHASIILSHEDLSSCVWHTSSSSSSVRNIGCSSPAEHLTVSVAVHFFDIKPLSSRFVSVIKLLRYIKDWKGFITPAKYFTSWRLIKGGESLSMFRKLSWPAVPMPAVSEGLKENDSSVRALAPLKIIPTY